MPQASLTENARKEIGKNERTRIKNVFFPFVGVTVINLILLFKDFILSFKIVHSLVAC